MLANLFGPAGWNAIATRSRLGQRLNWLRAMKKIPISISNRRESEIHKQQQQQQIQISSTFVNKLKQTNCALLLPHSRSRGERARERERERACVKESACGELDEERKVTAMAWYWILVLTRQNWSNNYNNNSKDLSLKPVWQSFFAAGKACVKSLLERCIEQ